MDSTRPDLPGTLRAPNAIGHLAMGRLSGILTSELDEPASSIPSLLGRYRLVRPIAEGASGKVYEAEDLQLGRRVAIKVLDADADALVKRFFREASVAAKLRHPNLITVHEVSMVRRGDGAPVHFIVMDLHPGTLESLLARKDMPRNERLKLLEAVARAVHHAHQNGIIHRDLKPANILIDEHGQPIVSDFGLAREESQSAGTRPGSPVGTPSYMSPEQVAGRSDAIGPRSDVYALGVILYRMLSDRLPFNGASVAEIYASILSEDPSAPAAERDLQTICLKAMAKDSSRRYPTAFEFAEDLRRFLAGEPILARPEGTLRRLRRAARRPPLWIGIGLVLAILIAWWVSSLSKRAAGADQERAVLAIESAFSALHHGRGEVLRYLEDSFHRGNDRQHVKAMLERVEDFARDLAAKNPGTRLPQAWTGLARVFAGDETGWKELDAAVDAAEGDPFPLLLRARARLAAYSRDAQAESTIQREGGRRTLELGTFVETASMKEKLALADADISRAMALPLWKRLPSAGEYGTYAEGASLLSRGDYEKAAARLAAVRDHAMLGAEAECLRGICFALGRDYESAAAAWERLGGRGWPMTMLAAARARLEMARTSADPVPQYERAASDAVQARGEGDLAKLSLLCAGISWQRIAGHRKGPESRDALIRARTFYTDSLKLDARQGPVLCELADVEWSLGNESDALRHAREAVNVEPRHPRSWQILCVLAQSAARKLGYRGEEAGRLVEESLAAAQQGIALEPEHPDLLYAAANVHWHAGRNRRDAGTLHEAIALYGRSLQRSQVHRVASAGERAHAWHDLGEALSRAGDDPRDAFQKSIAGYTEAMSLGLDPASGLRYRGTAHRTLAEYLIEKGQEGTGHLDQAEKDFAEAIRLNPQSAETFRLRAFVHRGRAAVPGASEKEHLRKAIEDLDRAIQLDPDLMAAYGDKAEAHAVIDEFDAALEAVAAGLVRKPGHVPLLDLQRRLRDFIKAKQDE